MKKGRILCLLAVAVIGCLLIVGIVFSRSSDVKAQEFAWPGYGAVETAELVFGNDASGLDYRDGKLYAVDNGSARVWILDVLPDGSVEFDPEYAEGMRVSFPDGETKPDAEGITVDSEGNVYLASESGPGQFYFSRSYLLQLPEEAEGSEVPALQAWDLGFSLPPQRANKGIEAVEWVSNDDLEGQLYDRKAGVPYDPARYPEAVSGGVFFVALEGNGHIYAFVLNRDGSVVRLLDADSGLGGAMALDYDTEEKVLWVVADDNHGNRAAVLSFNGTRQPGLVHVTPPDGVDPTMNHEGFAIGPATEDSRRVYRFRDGVQQEQLSLGSLAPGYAETLFPAK